MQTRSIRHRATLSTGIILASLMLSAACFAQERVASEEDRAQARTLFSEGVEAAQRSDWEVAASRFEGALALVTAPTVQYNLASAYLELGRLGEAGDLVVMVLANTEIDTGTREQAEALEAQIAARSGTLTVEVAPTGNEGAVVRVDGRQLAPERVGVARHEVPGDRTVELARVTGDTESQTVTVPEHGDARVTFGPPDDDGGDGAAALITSPVFWAVVAGGVALLIGTIAVVAVAAASTSGGPMPMPGGRMMLSF